MATLHIETDLGHLSGEAKIAENGLVKAEKGWLDQVRFDGPGAREFRSAWIQSDEGESLSIWPDPESGEIFAGEPLPGAEPKEQKKRKPR